MKSNIVQIMAVIVLFIIDHSARATIYLGQACSLIYYTLFCIIFIIAAANIYKSVRYKIWLTNMGRRR